MEIGYCFNCNVPLRGDRCGICGRRGGTLKFHELGDIRPASNYERRILARIIPYREVREYLNKRLILLSKQPGLDYRKDIFVDGFKIGIVEYIKDRKWRWKFTPTGKGAALFHLLSSVEDFKIESKGHLKGKRIKRDIRGDWAIFSSSNCIGVAVKTEKGTKIKDIYCGKIKTARKSSMKDTISANLGYLRKIENEAIEKIKRAKADYVAFSGGKDSETALYLAYKAGVKRAIYANTGLEFPETERFAYNFADYLGIELIEIRPKVDFWEMVEKLGIPAKDRRWCTKYLKLEGLKKFKGTIVDGSRKYESLGRMLRPQESKLGNLKVIYPILDWLALDVWLFLEWKKLPHNPLYDMGYERIGCFMCPSMLNSEFHNLKRTHPELFEKWYGFLREKGYTHSEIMDGTWRWNTLPRKMKGISKS